jgi:uncharacterized membrane protein YeiH
LGVGRETVTPSTKSTPTPVAEIPNVLRREFYAVAALLGAACVVVGGALGLPATPTAVVGALVCFVLRYVAIRRNWQLPVARADDGG